MEYLNDVPIAFSSVTQKHVMLSVTEAQLAAVVTMVQDMMYVYRVITNMGLQVELPMTAEMDNSGACDLVIAGALAGVPGMLMCECSSCTNSKRRGW